MNRLDVLLIHEVAFLLALSFQNLVLFKQPHELVEPKVSLLTDTMFPQSHLHIQNVFRDALFKSISLTTNLPNL